jgi:hypothetical protein
MQGVVKGRSPVPTVSKRTSTQAFTENYSIKRRKLDTGLSLPVFNDGYETPKPPFVWPIEPRTETCKNLLDLPVEIFEKIIGAMVDEVGPEDAYTKCRPVCTKFRHAIWRDLFRNLPTERLTRTRKARRILKDPFNLCTLLDYRITPLRYNTVIERLIISVKNRISTMSSNLWPEDELQMLIAETVQWHCKPAFDIIKSGHVPDELAYMANDDLHNALCVAVALENEDLVRELQAQGESLWTRTKAFLYPLNVALKLKDPYMLDVILPQDPNTLTWGEQQSLIDSMWESGLRLTWKRLRNACDRGCTTPIISVFNRFVDWCLSAIDMGSPIRLIDQLSGIVNKGTYAEN